MFLLFAFPAFSIRTSTFIYLNDTVSRAFCYAMRMMMISFFEVAGLTAEMDIGQRN